jgi:hypothetical protein
MSPDFGPGFVTTVISADPEPIPVFAAFLINQRFSMKYILAFLVLFCVSNTSELLATPLFVYNHGYVMGELTSVGLTGPAQRVVSGAVSIGNNSFGSESGGANVPGGQYVLPNPWGFCGGLDYYGELASRIGEFVVIEYKTPKNSSLLQCQTNNEIVGIYSISRDTPSSLASESTRINMAGKTYGVTVGRVVNAQKSDRHGANWSVVVQVGNGGNDFLYMQIIDADLYAMALDCLVSATRVKVYHVDLVGGVTGRNRIDTYLWRIEVRPGL